MPKLSELDPAEVEFEDEVSPVSLSDMDPTEVEFEEAPRISPEETAIMDKLLQGPDETGEYLKGLATGEEEAWSDLGETAMEGLESGVDAAAMAAHNVPVVSPMVTSGVASLGSMVSNQTEEEILAEIEQAKQERMARSPIAGEVGGLVGAVGGGMLLPGGQLAGARGVGAGLAQTSADQLAKTGEIDPEMLALEGAVGGGIVGGGKAMGAISTASDKVADWLKSKAARSAEDVLEPSAEQIKKSVIQGVEGQPSELGQVVETMLEKDMIRPESTRSSLERIQRALGDKNTTPQEADQLVKARDMIAEKYGRQRQMPLTKSQLIRQYSPVLKTAGLQSVLKKANVPSEALKTLQEAAERHGAKGVTSTHYLLMQQNEKYRESINKASSDQDDENREPGTPVYSTEDK